MVLARSYETVSRDWRDRIDTSHEYEIIGNDSVFRAGFHQSFVYESEYLRIRSMKEDLVARYEGVPIEEALPGRKIGTEDGEYYELKTRVEIPVPQISPERIREGLLSDLTLVKGVGPALAGRLRARGCRTIGDLSQHRRFGMGARACEDLILDGEPGDLVSLVSERHSPSHPLTLLSMLLFGSEGCIFLDLETMGFFSRPIILFGMASYRDGALEVSQRLVLDMDEELAALSAAGRGIRDFPVIVSYNGKAFDMPYLISRSAYYGEILSFTGLHADLLHASRRSFRKRLDDCRLATVEGAVLGVPREPDLPGSMVPEFYETYLRLGNIGPLVPIVDHNRADLVSLARLLTYFSGGGLHGGS
jgi:uncharacterized protein